MIEEKDADESLDELIEAGIIELVKEDKREFYRLTNNGCLIVAEEVVENHC